ncbi:MAG: transposase [Planctomycetota bacterium]
MIEPNERKRRHFTDDQKATIVRRHLGDKVPVSDLADEYQIQPSLIYLWVKQVLDQAERAFQQSPGKRGRPARDPKDQKIAVLEARVARQESKLAQKNSAIKSWRKLARVDNKIALPPKRLPDVPTTTTKA